MNTLVADLNQAIADGDMEAMIQLLNDPLLGLTSVRPENALIYQVLLAQVQDAKGVVSCVGTPRKLAA